MNCVRWLHHAKARIKTSITRLKELGLLRLVGAITRGQTARLVEALARLHHLRAVERVLVAQVYSLLIVIVWCILLLLGHGRRQHLLGPLPTLHLAESGIINMRDTLWLALELDCVTLDLQYLPLASRH